LQKTEKIFVLRRKKFGRIDSWAQLNNLNFQSRSYRKFFFTDMETTFLGKFVKFVMKEAQEVNVLSGIQLKNVTK
jgi:hypothetical protein